MIRGGYVWLVPVACAIACSEDGTTSVEPGLGTGGAGVGGALSGGSSPGGSSAGGGSPGGSSPGGSGGVSGTATGGTSTSGATPLLDACKAYVAAQCHRRLECKDSPSDCTEDFQQGCPDYFFSPGSARTVENMLACARDWAAFPCDQILRSSSPACALPGTRAPGDACLYGSQCDSGSCYNTDSDHCGVCMSTIPDGGACGSDRTKTCPEGQICVSSVCTPVEPKVTTVAALGEPCTASCAAGSFCLLDSNGAARCTVPPTAGQPCAKFGSTGTDICSGGFLCDASNVCEPGPVAGQPCAIGGVCGVDARCDPSAGIPGTCIANADRGAACGTSIYCKSGLRCLCVPGTACASLTCMTVLAPGAACGEPNTACEPGTQCQSGLCTPSDAVTTFADRCPGK